MPCVAAKKYKKLCYRRRTARRAVSQNLVNCRSRLYHKSTTYQSRQTTIANAALAFIGGSRVVYRGDFGNPSERSERALKASGLTGK